MKNSVNFIKVISLVAVIGFSMIACVDSSNNTVNQTPVADDYVIENLNQTAGSVTAVTITPKEGKSIGARTIYYEGVNGTTYARNTKIPQAAGTYAVTFDVAAVTGWNEAISLSAGNLIIGIQSSVSTPIANLESGSTITIGDNITLTTATEGATIRYTTNGNTPTTSSTLYSSPITITSSMVTSGTVTIKAIAIKSGMLNSVVFTNTYTINIPASYNVGSQVEWNTAINMINLGGNDKGYTIFVTDDFSIDGYGNQIKTFTHTSITVTIKGSILNLNPVISIKNRGSLLWIGTGQTVILEDVDLEGNLRAYTGSLYVYPVVIVDGNFTMCGDAKVYGNRNDNYSSLDVPRGGGVSIRNGGLFIMEGNASVSNNIASGISSGSVYQQSGMGGGVYISNGGSFIMRENASVSNNEARGISGSSGVGGGVYVGKGGTFNMINNASVNGNSVFCDYSFNFSNSGGGVYVDKDGTFSMIDNASVYENTCRGKGSGPIADDICR